MTPDEINIAIAEFCGLSDFIKTDCGECYGFGVAGGEQDSGGCGCCKNGHIAPYYTGPDYLKDLNAIHEAEKVMTTEQKREYVRNLFRRSQSDFESHCATAAQRAEAFLRTNAKWRDA